MISGNGLPLMGFPRTYNAIEDMIRKTVLHTRVARGIARKAGLVRGLSISSRPSRPVTLIDCFCILEAPKNEFDEGAPYQWEIDFSPYTRARISSSSDWQTHIVYSLNLVGEDNYMQMDDPLLDDWKKATGTYDDPAGPSFGQPYVLGGTWADLGFGLDPRRSGWTLLPEEFRAPVRFAISGPTSPGDFPLWLFDSGPFVFTLQAM